MSLKVIYSGIALLMLAACSEIPADESIDNTGFDFDNYYADAQGLQGQSLKSALNLIIRDHVKLSYANTWQALMQSEEDPNNSANLILFYSGRSVDKQFRSGLEDSPDAWNREHIWPKSHGFPSQSQHAYTDLHHLRAVDASINSSRSNTDFAMGGTPLEEAPENLRATDSFEPRNAVKGDVARMIFYMDVRYQGADNSETPDLFIVDQVGTPSGQPVLGKLCTLLEWHVKDPVSMSERQRNQVIYDIQGNRNPFIDKPDWANSIYASSC